MTPRKRFLHYNSNINKRARQLRSDMTNAERLLWSRIRRKQLHGIQFYRQKPILNYVVDFYCARASLIVEVDGGHHFEDENRQADIERQCSLEALGLYALRFDNRQVLTELDNVVAEIYRIMEQRLE